MRKILVPVFICILLMPVFARKLSIYTEFSGDSSFVDPDDNVLKGYSVDVVNELLRRLNLKSEIKILPWARAYYYLENNNDTMLFLTTRTVERENLFKWVGPVVAYDWVFFVRKNSGIRINSLEDAAKLKSIGTYKDDVKEIFLKNRGFKNIVSAYGEKGNIKNIQQLYSGEIDAVISSSRLFKIMAQNNGIDYGSFTKVYTIRKFYLYIAFSKDTDDSMVSSWQHELDGMKSDGTYLRIFKKYPDYRTIITFDAPGTM